MQDQAALDPAEAPSRGPSAFDGSPAARFGPAVAALARATFDNPVLVKEFRTRMRGTRAYWVLLGYTLLLAGVVAMMYFGYESSVVQRAEALGGGAGAEGARDLGRNIFNFVFIAQAIMVALITPAITSGTITIEREQRSYELLVTTPLRQVDLIRGKLIAAVSFVVLLLTASLPLVSLSFLVGGVSPAEIFFSYLVIALSAFVYGASGIFWSATLRTTAVATVVAYMAVLSLFIATLVPGMAAMSGGGPRGIGNPEIPFQSLHPIAATWRAVYPEYFFNGQIPSWVSSVILNLLLGMLIANLAMGRLEHFEPPRPFWTRFLSTLLWCAFGLFLFGPLLGATARGATTRSVVDEISRGSMLTVLVLACLVVPIYNTGDLIVRRGESALGRYLRGFLPHRMFRGDLSCGFPLVLSWTLFLLALLPLGMVLTGKRGLFDEVGVFIPGVILCLSVIVGLAGVGHLLSVTLPSRWAACILTYLAAVVLMILPTFTYFTWHQLLVRPKTPQPLWQLLYLVPWEGMKQLGTGSVTYWSEHPEMIFGRSVPVWIVTSAIYLLLAAVTFLATAARVRSEGRILQERLEAAERAFETPGG